MVSWTAIIIFLVITGVVYGLHRYLRAQGKRQLKKETRKPVKALAEDSWEREWLSTMRRDHRVLQIKPAKLKFKFTKTEDRKAVQDGFVVVCSCDEKQINTDICGLNLEMARNNYERHLEKEGEKALAAIGRFEMPAGVDWAKEARKELN